VKGQGKLNRHIICGVLVLFAKNYQNEPVLVETIACQSWCIFIETSVFIIINNLSLTAATIQSKHLCPLFHTVYYCPPDK